MSILNDLHSQQFPFLTETQALEVLNQLRCNIIGTQNASWSNTIYPFVAILNATGYEYDSPSEEEKRMHLSSYDGAGGYPGKLKERKNV